MDDKPKCKQCRFMNLTGRAKINSHNLVLGGERGVCMCEHPKAYEMFNKVCPRSNRMACFIGFTAPGENEPTIKTSPKWCPLRKENVEKEENNEQ